ncbi:MAG: hypothetical protein MJ153_04900 [Clostridia bacterium]|nr:hypothetical protein [Clostridia bacterium]
MKYIGRKATAVSLCFSLVAGFTLLTAGCSMRAQIQTDDVNEITENFCEAIIERDIIKLKKCLADDGFEDVEKLLNFADKDNAFVYEEIANSLSYEFDESDIEIKDNQASVEVTFNMVDYEAMSESFEANGIVIYLNSEDLIEEFGEIEKKVTLECSLDEDNGGSGVIVTDGKSVVEDLFKFAELDFECEISEIVMSSSELTQSYKSSYWLGDYIIDTFWSDGGDNSFTNVSSISFKMKLDFPDDAAGEEYIFYYSVYRDSELLFSTEFFYVSGSDDMCSACINTLSTYDEDYLSAGNYTVYVFDATGECIAEGCQEVYINAEEPLFEEEESLRDYIYSTFFVRDTGSNKGKAGNNMCYGEWLETTDEPNTSSSFYCTENVTEIKYHLVMNDDYEGDIYCEYRYVEDVESPITVEEFKTIPLISDGITSVVNKDSVNEYIFTIDVTEIGAGGYVVYFYTEGGDLICFDAVGVE